MIYLVAYYNGFVHIPLCNFGALPVKMAVMFFFSRELGGADFSSLLHPQSVSEELDVVLQALVTLYLARSGALGLHKREAGSGSALFFCFAVAMWLW